MQDHHTTTPSGVTTKMVLPRGEQGILPGAPKLLKPPQAFKGPHEALIFTFMGCIDVVSHFPSIVWTQSVNAWVE